MIASGVYTERRDAYHHDPIPLKLLILCSLRILTRNYTYDDLLEATHQQLVIFLSYFAHGILKE